LPEPQLLKLNHKGLKVGRDFSTWIKYRIESRRLVEGRHYTVTFGSPDLGSQTGRGGNRNPVKQHHLTLDSAKALAMLENIKVGDKVREYFIAAEKQLKPVRPLL
jgi:anti-repressor protein